MRILGTKYFGHDSSICILDFELETISALTSERFTRIKHDEVPISVLEDFLGDKVFNIITHSFSHFHEEDRCIESKKFGVRRAQKILAERGFNTNIGKIDEISDQTSNPRDTNKKAVSALIEHLTPVDVKDSKTQIQFCDHHLSHAYCAYFTSEFYNQNTIILSIDGQGDSHFSKCFVVENNRFHQVGASKTKNILVDHKIKVVSIGNLYSNFTEALGFRRNSDEGKVEALAAHAPSVSNVLNQLKASIIIDKNAIDFDPELIKPFYDDLFLEMLIFEYSREELAATIQEFLEWVIIEYINSLEVDDSIQNLCLSGGVAANIIMNLKIFENTRFRSIHVTPFVGDEGTAFGSAILAADMKKMPLKWINEKVTPYLGPTYNSKEILDSIDQFRDLIRYKKITSNWWSHAARELDRNRVIAIFNGNAEFGPRALGNRSILANPLEKNLREKLNKIKNRPIWQPFCPAILEEDRLTYFNESLPNKYMSMAFRLKDEFRELLNEITNNDGTTRPQFVEYTDTSVLYSLLKDFKKLTGHGVLINTSFNIHGLAMVMKPQDAIQDFLNCDLDLLYFGNHLVSKK